MTIHRSLNSAHTGLTGHRFALSLVALVLTLFVHSTVAATRTWKGGHASSSNWNLRDNWSGGVVPTHGDALVFPANAQRRTNTNNIIGLRLATIQFTGAGGGHVLRGESLIIKQRYRRAGQRRRHHRRCLPGVGGEPGV